MPITILIVEDNELNRKLYVDFLRAQGYATIVATDGLEALAAVQAKIPDLVMMDVQLPDISGIEVIRRMRQNPAMANVPIIAITAFAMKGDKERMLANGFDSYLAKPCSVIDIQKMVRRFTSAMPG